MMKDDLDRILSREQEITPSSGFVDEVMVAVHREASAPPAIPFPWKRALPGIGAAAVSLMFLLASVLLMGSSAQVSTLGDVPPALTSLLLAARHIEAGWIAVALLISFACIKLAKGFAPGTV